MFQKKKKYQILQIILLLMMLIIVNSITFAGTTDEQEEQAILQILTEFDKLIFDNLGKNGDITNRCALYKEKMNLRELSIVIDHTLDQDIYGGMGFTWQHPKTGLPAIVIGPYFLKIYKDGHHSIFFSALMHEITHANDFFS